MSSWRSAWYDRTTAESLRNTAHAMLAALTPREAMPLRMRFGIHVGTGYPLEEIAERFDAVRTGIRLEERARILSTARDHFLTRVRCLPWAEGAATHLARVAVDLHDCGSPIVSMDAMIVGHALAVGAVLVTRNGRTFARITGLKTENWTRS